MIISHELFWSGKEQQSFRWDTCWMDEKTPISFNVELTPTYLQ